MTDQEPDVRSSTTVEQAINEVLQAEHNATQAVDACKQEAMQIQQTAQQRAKQIASRTNERLAICHMRCNSKISHTIKERERLAATGQGSESSYRLDAAALTAVVEALALTLTGVTPDQNGSRDT
jgi:vacuolar-type H+-ATPase subunit H